MVFQEGTRSLHYRDASEWAPNLRLRAQLITLKGWMPTLEFDSVSKKKGFGGPVKIGQMNRTIEMQGLAAFIYQIHS